MMLDCLFVFYSKLVRARLVRLLLYLFYFLCINKLIDYCSIVPSRNMSSSNQIRKFESRHKNVKKEKRGGINSISERGYGEIYH
jgi:hypothetical protein